MSQRDRVTPQGQRCGKQNPADIHTCTPQPEALRLADALESPTIHAGAMRHEIAAELRRLHAQRDDLLAALKEAVGLIEIAVPFEGNTVRTCRAAIAKVEASE